MKLPAHPLPDDLVALAPHYRNSLLDDTLPFWLEHGLDPDHGGMFTSLGRDGSLLDSDKAVWHQGRSAWMFATLLREVEPRPAWRVAAHSCLTFLEEHCFDEDGRMFFLVTQKGRPLRKRRYAYSEAFACMAYAASAAVTGEKHQAERAVELFQHFVAVAIQGGGAEPKVNPKTRPSQGIGPWMIGLNLVQTLRDNLGLRAMDDLAESYVRRMERDFCSPEHEAVLETVTPGGNVIDHFEGRTLNPGHAIEAAWFVLKEAEHRGDAAMRDLGINMLDWSWKRGWDEVHGGLFAFRDLYGGPVQEPSHDMKYWWPHCEALIANLLALRLTGEERFGTRFRTLHAWVDKHFADPKHGEWYGYLHRNGSPSLDLKGNHWKGLFHLPRMQLLVWQMLERG